MTKETPNCGATEFPHQATGLCCWCITMNGSERKSYTKTRSNVITGESPAVTGKFRTLELFQNALKGKGRQKKSGSSSA